MTLMPAGSGVSWAGACGIQSRLKWEQRAAHRAWAGGEGGGLLYKLFSEHRGLNLLSHSAHLRDSHSSAFHRGSSSGIVPSPLPRKNHWGPCGCK